MVSLFFHHFTRGLSSAVDLLEVATVCYFFFLLRLIPSLAAETGHLHSLTDKKADPNSRSCFVSVLVLYFLFNGVELLHCGCAWGSSTSPELHLCTSTWSYGLASDEISVLRLDMKGRFKDCKKKKSHKMVKTAKI